MSPTVLVFVLTMATLHAERWTNDYPVIFVAGFGGWGRTELHGMNYFGGFEGDFQEKLTRRGFRIYTAAVGPFSSNWDRACELYAMIKGGQVDYGENHARYYGHHRFGRSFRGLYPEWGTLDSLGRIRKVHLVGHSMGGQTIRVLNELLASGTSRLPCQRHEAPEGLFRGGQHWVHSITTLSTPHHGTMLCNGLLRIGPQIVQAVASFFGLLGFVGRASTAFYDAKLDQWDIGNKRRNETLVQFFNRLRHSKIFSTGFEDISMYDVCTPGAKRLNDWIKMDPNVYYFSFSTQDTYSTTNRRRQTVHRPNRKTMFLPMQPISLFIGGPFVTANQGFPALWQANDGVVNTASMPGCSGHRVEYNGTIQRQRWHHMPLLDQMDHGAIIGLSTNRNHRVLPLYIAHFRLLHTLP